MSFTDWIRRRKSEDGPTVKFEDQVARAVDAVKSGLVDAEEHTLRAFGAGQGVAGERIDEFVTAVKGDAADDDDTEPPEGEEPGEGELEELAKSDLFRDRDAGRRLMRVIGALKADVAAARNDSEDALLAASRCVDEIESLASVPEDVRRISDLLKSELVPEVDRLKADLSQPADARKPVRSRPAGEPAFEPETDSTPSPGEVTRRLKAGIAAGKLNVDDAIAYETEGELTPRAKAYLAEKEGV